MYSGRVAFVIGALVAGIQFRHGDRLARRDPVYDNSGAREVCLALITQPERPLEAPCIPTIMLRLTSILHV